jgi:hypothetical protein
MGTLFVRHRVTPAKSVETSLDTAGTSACATVFVPKCPEFKLLAQTADEGIVSHPRFRTAALAGALLVCLGACSNSHIGPGGRVTTADLRAGKLPVAVEVCVTGVATYYDALAGTLVVQDLTGAVKFDNVNAMIPRYGVRIEVCGETRRAQSGMTLAKPNVKLGEKVIPRLRGERHPKSGPRARWTGSGSRSKGWHTRPRSAGTAP